MFFIQNEDKAKHDYQKYLNFHIIPKLLILCLKWFIFPFFI